MTAVVATPGHRFRRRAGEKTLQQGPNEQNLQHPYYPFLTSEPMMLPGMCGV